MGHQMIKIGKLTDYAIVIVTKMAMNPKGIYKVSDIVHSTSLPKTTIAKIMKLLANAGILQSARGIHGGYSLTKRAEDITIHDIIKVIEGPISLMNCLDEERKSCSIVNLCSMKNNWEKINDEIKETLSKVTIHEMAFHGHSFTENNMIGKR